MVRMSQCQRKKYDRLADFIDAEIPSVKTKKKVFDAYKKYVGLGNYKGTEHLTALNIFQGPRLVVRQLGRKVLGRFSVAFPNRILLDKDLAMCFQRSEIENELGRRLIECTILHELIHLYDWKGDRRWMGTDENDSHAFSFEKEAYGQVLSRDYAGWSGKKCK